MIRSNLAILMAKNKIRAAELSRMTGISQGALSYLYNEKTTKISFDTLDKLCEALECEVGELFERVPNK